MGWEMLGKREQFAKWASLAAVLAWLGLGPAELVTGTTSGSEAAQDWYEGWDRHFVELHPHPTCQSHPVLCWCFVAIAGLFIHVRSSLFLFVRTACHCTVRLNFSLCAFIKAELCLLFNPPGSPVRCFCRSS